MTTTTEPRAVETHPDRENLLSDTIRVEGLTGTSFDLCQIGIVPEGREARQKQGGPMISGPWGYAVTRPLVIDDSGMSARQRAQAIVVRAGEPLSVDGLPGVWALRSPGRGEGDGPQLVEWAEGLS